MTIESDFDDLNSVFLEELGDDLDFDFGSIKGFFKQSTYSVQGLDSIYDIERQDTSFYIDYIDFYQYNIQVKDVFKYYIINAEYRFEITSYVVQLDGWVLLKVNMLGLG